MSELPVFTPVPVRARRDGWTAETQARFIFTLARTRNVAAACRAVGRSWQTAYRLRHRPDAGSFAAAWDAVLAPAEPGSAFAGRALGGTARPVRYRGRPVGERRRFDNRLGMFLLRLRAPERYGTAASCRGRTEVAAATAPDAPAPAATRIFPATWRAVPHLPRRITAGRPS